MNPQTWMLIWKECQERRAQALVCLLWMLGGTIYVMAYEATRQFRAPVASFYSMASMFGVFMPVFLAMRTALGELTDRTKAFSDALPISAQRRGWIRLAGGAALLIVPILLGALLLSLCLAAGWLEQAPARMPRDAQYVQLPDRASLSAWAAVGLLWRVTAIVACSASWLYLLLSLVGTRLRAESHAGFVGTALALLWLLTGELRGLFESHGPQLLADWIGALAPQAMITNYGYGHERGSYGDLYLSRVVFGPLLINAAIQMNLAMLFVILYARKLAGRKAKSRKPARAWRCWSLPLPTRGISLVWLTLRQAVPMCLPGLMIACLMTPIQMGNSFGYVDALPSAMWIIGILWSVVVGSGILSAEIDARIGEFWRTLPIPPWRLFATKFVVGLLVVLLVLDGSVIAATWQSPHWGDYYSMNWPYIAIFLPLHATMFALAVAWTCLLRRAVLGGMATIVCFALLNVVLEWSSATRDLGPIEVYNKLGMAGRSGIVAPPDFTAHGYPLVATMMGLVMLASIILGARALGRYQPRWSQT